MINKILHLDVETTGIGDEDRVCQVAYKFHGQDGHEALFKPPVPITTEAMAITHITNEDVAEKEGFQESKMFTTLQKEFDDGAIFVAHNAQFDMKFIEREGLKLPKHHICTLKIAQDFDKNAELPRYTLQFLRYNYRLIFDTEINPHDAMSDVLVLEKLFEFYLKHYTIEEMIEISSKPFLIKRAMFGKHRGKLFKEIAKIDIDYLTWMRRVMDLDEDMKYTVEYYINNR